MPPRAFPAIPTLEIFTDEGGTSGQDIRLPRDSTRYQLVETLIHLALRLLETPEGRNSLVATATSIMRERDSTRRGPKHIYNRPMSELPQWIDHFLRIMRGNFPLTYLAHMEGDAMAVRQGGTIDMRSFNPKLCGYVDLNRTIISNMILCHPHRKSNFNYDRFKFQMVISIAHEIVHFLTGFLTGKNAARDLTPPRVGLVPYGSALTGEAGRYWEKLLLGGVAEFYFNPSDPMGKSQAGLPYLFPDGSEPSVGAPIDTDYIEAFVEGCKK